MEIRVILFVLATILVHTNSEDPLEVQFENPDDRYAQLGSEVILNYHVNRGAVYALQNKVVIQRHSMKNGQEVVEELAETAKLTNAQPKFYNVSIEYTDMSSFTINFKINEVRDVDDATFVAKVTPKPGSGEVETNSSVKVIVLRQNTKLSLEFANSEPFSETIATPFQVDAGSYPVTCKAEGSNPGTQDIKIYFNGRPIVTSDQTIEKMDTPLTRYSSTIRGSVNVEVANSGQDVQCIANSMLKENMKTQAPIKVNVYDPEIECEDGTSFVGQRYKTLSCTVNEEGHDISSYAFEFGKTGEIIYVGEQGKAYDEVKKTDLGDSKVRVDLNLYKTEDSHFANYYLVITHKNGHISKEAVVLTEIEGPKDSSSMLGASLTTLVLCAVCVLLQTL